MVRQTMVSEGVQRCGREAGVGRRRADVGRGSETRGRGVVVVVEQMWVIDGVSQAEVPRRKAEAWSKSRRRSRLGSRTMTH